LLLLFAVLTYLVQVLAILAQSLIQGEFLGHEDAVIGLLSCILIFGAELASLSDAKHRVWYPYIGSYLIALVVEPVIETLAFLVRPPAAFTYIEFTDVIAVTARYFSLVLVLALYFGYRNRGRNKDGKDTERQSLLKNGDPAGRAAEDPEEGQGTDYGSTSDSSTDASQSLPDNAESPWERREREASEQMEKRLREKGNWFTYAKSLLVR
jgi:hypothetical protein